MPFFFLFFAVPGPVRSLNFDNIQDRSLRITWSPPSEINGVLTGMERTYKKFKKIIKEYLEKWHGDSGSSGYGFRSWFGCNFSPQLDPIFVSGSWAQHLAFWLTFLCVCATGMRMSNNWRECSMSWQNPVESPPPGGTTLFLFLLLALPEEITWSSHGESPIWNSKFYRVQKHSNYFLFRTDLSHEVRFW